MMIKALMVSGGLDSYLGHCCYPDAILVFVDYGQNYLDLEYAAAKKLYGNKLNFVKIEGLPDLSDRVHVDARNLQLATIGMRFADTVIFSGVKDEICSDKNPKAFREMSEMLTKFSENRTIKITSPFWKHTKAQVVAAYLKDGGDPNKLLETVSCYSGGNEPCLNCQACFRRFVALKSNGIDAPRPSKKIIKTFGLRNLHRFNYKRSVSILKAVESDEQKLFVVDINDYNDDHDKFLRKRENGSFIVVSGGKPQKRGYDGYIP